MSSYINMEPCQITLLHGFDMLCASRSCEGLNRDIVEAHTKGTTGNTMMGNSLLQAPC